MLDSLDKVLLAFSFSLGACIASFLNVVIWRVPRGESIVSPPSHCPKCNAAIRWYQNIPILAWLALRGRCANCKAPISPRYILVETLGGVLFAAAYLRCGLNLPLLVVMWIWISLMIAGSFIDYDLQLLPDFVTVGGMVLGLAYAALETGLAVYGSEVSSWTVGVILSTPIAYSVYGLLLGFGLMLFIRWLGSLAFRREAMGMGDVFLMGGIGAIFGPIAVLVTLVLSSFIGSLFGLGMIAASKIRLGKFVAIPFGPYICLGCLAWMFFGSEILSWYLKILL